VSLLVLIALATTSPSYFDVVGQLDRRSSMASVCLYAAPKRPVVVLSASRANPYDASNFLVEIAGVPTAAFTECVLPVASIEVIEYRQGADVMNNIHKLPGLVKYGNLVLKRGLANSTALWDWFSSFVTGTGTMQTVTVTLLDGGRNPVMRWSFNNAWPVKYESPVLNGKTSALAIETLEVAVEGMKFMSALSQST
jgi:phage tail-like protein